MDMRVKKKPAIKQKKEVVVDVAKINPDCKILCINAVSGETRETTCRHFMKSTEHFWQRRKEILDACVAAFTQNAYRSGISNLDGLFVRWEQQKDGTVKITATIQREEITSIRPLEEETLL